MDRETFLKPITLKTNTITVEEIGRVTVQEMSQSEGAKFEVFNQDCDPTDRKLKLITLCLVSDEGNRFLTEADFPQLREMPFNVINKLAFEIMRINGFLEDEATQEDYEKEFSG